MRSASAGRFGVLFLGLVVGLLLGRLWLATPTRGPLVLQAAGATPRAGFEACGDQVVDLLEVRHDFMTRHAARLQREARAIETEYPYIARYLSIQEVMALALLGSYAQHQPRPEFCERRWVLTGPGLQAQDWVCQGGRICAPDLLECFRSLCECPPSASPEPCLAEFSACRGHPPIRSEDLGS